MQPEYTSDEDVGCKSRTTWIDVGAYYDIEASSSTFMLIQEL